MGEHSGIAWTHHTFNPWIGCTEVSPACDHCYARTGSARLGAQHGLKLWDGDRFFTGRAYWKQPIAWNAKAKAAGERHRVFCASMADVFDGYWKTGVDVLGGKRDALFRLIEATPSLDWLLLTKRPENMMSMTPRSWASAWPANVWAGVTAENQEWANTRVPLLLRVPASIRFVSVEPMLGPVDFCRIEDRVPGTTARSFFDALRGAQRIDWMIVGGESGAKARPFDVAAAHHLRDQAKAAGTAYFMKQLGARPWDSSKLVRIDVSRGFPATALEGNEIPIKSRKGDDMSEWPEALRVQEFPRRKEV